MLEVITCDLDSTISNTLHRRRLIDPDRPDWLAYALASENDIPMHQELIGVLGERRPIIFVSSRPEGAREVTINWLVRHGFRYLDLVLDENSLSPEEFKVTALKKVMETYKVVLHVDDRTSIKIAIESELGIPTVVVNGYYV